MQKTAIVSGTDHGLGASLVTELAYRGYRVIAGRLHLEKETEDGQTAFLPLDLSDQDSIERFAARAGKLVQSVDLLINNAGILGNMRSTICDRLDRNDIRRVIEVNAIGTLMLTNALYPLIEKGEGKMVVNISSEAGSVSECWHRVYIATMRVYDEESEKRVARHRAQRADKGFATLECPMDLAGAGIEPGSTVLLEDIPNLLANEMFEAGAQDAGRAHTYPRAGRGAMDGRGT